MYRPVPRKEITDALIHIRDLYRRIKPSNEQALLAHERRELSIRGMLSNLPRTAEHPTLKSVLEVAEICSLTLEGAHRLFGYSLERIREYDLRLNGGRTHIIESYPFERDLPVDLPLRLASRRAFAGDAFLRDLVPEWQTERPIKSLDGEGWSQKGAFYVHVGTEDSLGSAIPSGAMALVEPIGHEEALCPSPRRIYLLQFGNGYRCSHCVVTWNKLRLFSTGREYLGREEFLYPGTVRIVGRIRMFAMDLPAPAYPSLGSLPDSQNPADLILPWEHASRDRLFATKHRRFRRSKEQEQLIRDVLKAELQAKLSERSERRYRGPTSSEPHVNALIHLTVAHAARYTDALRAGGSLGSDGGRFSLESILAARHIEDLLIRSLEVHRPTPADVWDGLRNEFAEWPPLLSRKFPQLKQWDERIIRLSGGRAISGLDPWIGPGSWILLEKIAAIPDTRLETEKTGWSRPLYVLRRGLESFCGYLNREDNRFALLSGPGGQAQAVFNMDEISSLSRIAGVAVPV